MPQSTAVLARAPVGEGGKFAVRPYTPISSADQPGHVRLMVKSYEDGEWSANFDPCVFGGKLPAMFADDGGYRNSCFPGTVSKFFANLDVGDQVEMQGPIKKLQYEPNKYRHIVMLAGGSGLTPMTQVADKILRTDGDNTKVTLLFANRTEDDILARDWCVMLVLFSV